MKLYLLDISELTEEDIRMVRRFFPRRAGRADRFVFEKDRLSAIGAGVLLRCVLKIDERAIETEASGRPRIPGGPGFSLSHSGGRCLLAVGRGSIGADIERLDESNLAAAESVTTKKELEWMRENALERFHVLWTRKESVYKAVGGYDDPRDIPALEEDIPKGFHIKSIVSEGFALSVCSQEEPGELETTHTERTYITEV